MYFRCRLLPPAPKQNLEGHWKFFYVHCVVTLLQIVETLLPLPNLEARVDSAVDLITSAHKNISADALRFAATTFYYKLKAADDYAPAAKYHGNVMLIRAKTSSQYEQNLGADYKLSEVGRLSTATVVRKIENA